MSWDVYKSWKLKPIIGVRKLDSEKTLSQNTWTCIICMVKQKQKKVGEILSVLFLFFLRDNYQLKWEYCMLASGREWKSKSYSNKQKRLHY